ncbi:type II secretion system GspH family protein [Sulfurimonas sp. HSL-3221]|uniref:type II secretion system protein n=1 Tax=Sulfurimonadaceae TaxID=2771471 RepID=UPI001E2F9E95|nr:type II secretion system protein [Sulfurimonas sp. HSL-3221]UFS63123.1 type II secretion system GspH family protein [Sulfurimonas sp. HSL-3221]
MKKAAFTMIELIFVMLVLGILAVIAIPRLAAVRDDAEISRMASDVMTGSFECAAHVVARGAVDPTMSNMSQAIKNVVIAGKATESPRHVSFIMGTIPNCVMLDINQSSDGNVEEIQLSYANAGSDDLCLGLHDVIDEGKFPIPLKGRTIVR